MIDNFLLLLTIIVIFSISILIYIIINNKEGFKNIDGEKGIILPIMHGIPGRIGTNGTNGKHWGNLNFKNEKNEIIDQLLNPTDKNKNLARDIIVPNAIQGKTGEVGTILFVNHKKEIIGSYNLPDGSYEKTLKPIIINVPQGIKGEQGDNGSDNTHPPEQHREKGHIGGEDIFKDVKVSNKVCFKKDTKKCIDFEILKTLVNYDDYLKELENRRLRIIRQLCYLEFYEDYNKKEHPNREELIKEYKKQLEEIYDFNGEPFNYEENINKENGNCPEFPEKPLCKFNDNHLDVDNEYLFEDYSCNKLTTNCGVGQFISRAAYKDKDDKNRDIYISDNKCAECTVKREHIDKENGDVYVGCDGVYDGIVANCKTNQYIEVTPRPEGYVCKDCGTCSSGNYKAGGCSGTQSNNCKPCENCSISQYETNACNHNHNRTCANCINSCPTGQYLTGSCGGNGTLNNSCNSCTAGYYCRGDRNLHTCPTGQVSGAGAGSCNPCPCGQEPNENKTECTWKTDGYYQFYEYDGTEGCSKIDNSIPYNNHGRNAVSSAILIPARGVVSVYKEGNYEGECIDKKNDTDSQMIWNIPESHNDKVESIRINAGCYRGRDYCWENCKTTGKCDWCGIGHNCCRQEWGGGNNQCKYWDGNYFDHVCTKAH